MERSNPLPDDPLWYKDAIFYELRVRSFCDGSGDGIGDFQGLTEKLDYLVSLGVTAIWLLPFYPSPLRDDGYDISDYMDVHPECGTLRDCKVFLREAHRRGLRVVAELVPNHTSDQHPWFQRARRAPSGNPYRDFYIWSDTPERFKEARIIFQDFEPTNWTWDPLAKAYYLHRFYSHQPDLNYDNPLVREAILKVVDFWFELGVDGLRLDAVPYLYKREGTSCENLPETHAFLRELRRHVDRKFANRMLLAEANQWPEEAVAYLAEGKECQMAFHFPLMPRIFMAVRMEDRFPVADIWAQTPATDESCQWALFLRNHDELTLEMVTDEERDFMYRAYAKEARMRLNLGIRRRLAPLLGNNRRTIELVNGLLFSMPGTPVIYYGDEIGMGDNVYLGDRDGVRTPMQWSADRNAGFSKANPQRLVLPVNIDSQYHYQAVNVEAQEGNLHSLLWWTRRLIALRKQFKAFGRGAIEFLSPENPRVLAFVRSYQDERVLVVANLSRFVQHAELDLTRFKALVPVEVFGRSAFPTIGERPYPFMLGPHAFNWFSLENRAESVRAQVVENGVARIEAAGSLEQLLRSPRRSLLERALPDFLGRSRWFRGKARNVKKATFRDSLPMPERSGSAVLAIVDVEYANGEPDAYLIPMIHAEGDRAAEIRSRFPLGVLAELKLKRRNGGREGLVCDAMVDEAFLTSLLDLIRHRRAIRGTQGVLKAFTTAKFRELARFNGLGYEPRPLRAEQSNSSAVYGDRLVLKLMRCLGDGISPELEIGRFLTERSAFSSFPPLAGWLEYGRERSEPQTVALLHGYVPNQGDAWSYTLKELNLFFERVLTEKFGDGRVSDTPWRKPIASLVAMQGPQKPVADAVGAYLDAATLLGRRAAELHLALATDSESPDFAPEPCTSLYLRSTYQSMRNLAARTFRLLRTRMSSLAEDTRRLAQQVYAQQDTVARRFDALLKLRPTAQRIRCHGDLHLGQILNTGKDFVFIDFEGEPQRPIAERRGKHPPLRDVAGMLRSFEYAARTAATEEVRSGTLGKKEPAEMEPWVKLWQTWTSWAFLKSYLETASGAAFMPQKPEELQVMLEAFLLEKALYEVGYELAARPDWVGVPLNGLAQILEVHETGAA